MRAPRSRTGARTRRVLSASLPSTSASSCCCWVRSRSCRHFSQSAADGDGPEHRRRPFRRLRLKPYPSHTDGGVLSPTQERFTRWFVGLSLLLGGLVLLAEAAAFGTLRSAPL